MQPQDQEELDLQKYWLILKRRWLPATGVFSTVLALSALAAVLQKPVYTAYASLLVKADRSSSLVGLTNETGDLQALTTNNSPVETQAQIVRSDAVIREVIRALNLRDKEGQLASVSDVSQQLKVKNVATTDVLELSYSDGDPQQAAAVVNQVIQVYIANNIAANRAETAAAGEFIRKQLPRVEASVHAAEQDLRQFKEANQIVALDTEATAAVNTMAAIDQKITDTQADLSKVATRANALRQQLGMNAQQAAAMTALSQTAGVQEVLTQYQQVQSQLAIEQARYERGHPTVENLQRQADQLRSLLQERVQQALGSAGSVSAGGLQLGELREDLAAKLIDAEVERLSLGSQYTTLQQTLAAYRSRASVLPKLAQSQSELQRKLDAAQSTYETLLTRLQEVEVAENQNIGNARIISNAAVPEEPSGVSKHLYLMGGGMAGLLLAVAAAFMIDLCDRSLKTVQEARTLFGYTLLGLIPSYHKLTNAGGKGVEQPLPKIFPRDLPRSSISEAFHMLQANLKFLSSDKEIKVVVVTSSVAQEGKSTIAANLAAAAAQVGRRVLLVDADMRYPQQHHLWDLLNTGGLSNVIVGQQELSNAIQPAMLGLDVLPAGVIPPNPVALLDSRRMASLIETFAQAYDLVILDTPPLMGVADAAILGKMSDGILLAVRPGVVDSTSAAIAKDLLVQSSQTVLGLVANAVIANSERDSYFYHQREQLEPELTAGGTRVMPLTVTQFDEIDRL